MRSLHLVFIVFLFSSGLFCGCEKEVELEDSLSDTHEPETGELAKKYDNLIQASNAFAFESLQSIADSQALDANLMTSPLSISLALAMTANGARGNTLDEMLEVLGFQGYSMEEFNAFYLNQVNQLLSLDDQVDLSIANSIWNHDSFHVLPSFFDVNQQYYSAEIAALDFKDPGSVSIINNWVSEATQEKIPEVIETIPSTAVMYLINAIYFMGEWTYAFDSTLTEDGAFYKTDGSTLQVPMMQMEADIRYAAVDGHRIVELPYGGNGDFVMSIVLPKYGEHPVEVINSLSESTWNDWIAALDTSRSIHLAMPRFSFEYNKSLGQHLQEMGIHDLFSRWDADLSGIDGKGDQLWVSQVLHKTFIEVNESGTEAAAVTAVEFVTESCGDCPISITLNRPFVFIIREVNSGVIVFSGVLADPLEATG